MLTFGSLTLGFRVWGLGFRVQGLGSDLPLVSREWRNGVQLLLLLLPFFHSLLTKGRKLGKRLDSSQARSTALQVFASGLSSGQFH